MASRLGFILLSAGCAIGIGNVWKFPWMTGQYGGGAFVVIYLLFLLILGVPVLTMEFAMGRAAQKSPLKMYQALKPGGHWGWHGYVCLLGNVVLMMFYTTVAGWMLQYFVDTAAGRFVGLDVSGVETAFGNMLANPVQQTVYMGVIVISGFFIISIGVQKGLERVTKWMMMALIVLMLALAAHSLFLPGGSEGLKFYLLPDIQRLKDAGVGNVIVGAMNQSFFTLSLGIGAMAIFGSYIGKNHALAGESVRVCALDTLVALCSGLIIFPACFSYGVDVKSGPALIFMTLPNVFNNLPAGRFWGSLFFLFMTFAAYSTVLAVFENIVSCVSELTGLEPEEDLPCVRHCPLPAEPALPAGLQPVEQFPPHRRAGRAGQRGFSGQQPAAAPGQSAVHHFLHHPLRLGLGEFPRRSQRGQRAENRQMAAALHDLRAARDRGHHSGFRPLQLLRRVNAAPKERTSFGAILSIWQDSHGILPKTVRNRLSAS